MERTWPFVVAICGALVVGASLIAAAIITTADRNSPAFVKAAVPSATPDPPTPEPSATVAAATPTLPPPQPSATRPPPVVAPSVRPTQVVQAAAASPSLADQWQWCGNAWTDGVLFDQLEAGGSKLNEYDLRRRQNAQTYLQSYCIGIGTHAGSSPDGHASCNAMLSIASLLARVQQSGGIYVSSYFVQFEKREVDNFLTAARC